MGRCQVDRPFPDPIFMNHIIPELVEQGLASPTDRDFAERLTVHRGRMASLTADIEAVERQLEPSRRTMTPEIVGRFGNMLRDGLRGDNPALRQAYVRLLIDQVVVEDEQVLISGSGKALERAVVATAAGTRKGVPIFAREWRARQDSNLRPHA